MTTKHQPGETPTSSPDQNPSQRQKSLPIYLILLVMSVPLMLLVGPPASTVIFFALLLSAVIVLSDYKGLRLSALQFTLPRIAINTRLSYVLEILLTLLVLFSVTQTLQNWSLDQRVRGGEFSYLINSGVIAANVYHKTGAIPLWDPFIGHGEPLVENPFSFVFNPLMTLPIFWYGAIQGTKIAVLLHIGLMGLGGWLLAWVLGLKAPARLLLALLLGASGSMAGAIGMGFYQVGLSQAYVPWVYAGLLGTIYRPRQRVMLALLIVASALLIFAGTFWYALPTALGCGLLVAFHLVHRDPNNRRWRFDGSLLRRVAFAGVLLIVLTAIRLLPQAVNRDYIDHPLEFLAWGPIDYLDILRLYVTPSLFGPFDVESLYYHYIIPLGLVVFLALGRLLIGLLRFTFQPRWRVIIPGFILIILFSAWAQGGTPFMLWLYSTFTFLREWRFVGRMQAAGTPWIAIIAAIWVDNLITVLADNARLPDPAFLKRWRVVPPLVTITCGLLLLATLIVCALSVTDVLKNWENWSGTELSEFVERNPLYYLRSQDPGGFISVQTSGFYGYIPFYETYIRATFGNPDYHAVGMKPTLGTTSMMNFPPAYAFSAGGDKDPNNLWHTGFQVMPESQPLFGWALLWNNPAAVPYMFIAQGADLATRQAPLTRDVTQPVNNFVHSIDDIEASVSVYALGSVLVAQEVAYPGWEVTVDGQPAQLESVGGMVGVFLPPQTGAATHVVFTYRPIWLYVGAAISLIGFIAFVIYTLRLDRFFRRENPPNTLAQTDVATPAQ